MQSRLLNKHFPRSGLLDLFVLQLTSFAFLSISPCFAQGEDVWAPDFDTNGIKSKVVAAINQSVRWGFINKDGKFVIEPKYLRVKNFSNGMTTVEDSTGCFDLDKAGKQLTKPISRIQLHEETNKKRWDQEAKDAASEKLHGFKGDILDSEGKNIIALNKDVKIGEFSEGLASCKFPQKMISSLAIDEASCAKNGESTDVPHRQMNNCGYIDEKGRLVIPPRFYHAGKFKDGIASVMNWKKISESDEYRDGFINKAGELIGGRYLDDDRYAGTDMFWQDHDTYSEGLSAVKSTLGKWGYIDQSGNVHITPQFDRAGSFVDDLAYAKTSAGFGFIDKSGKFQIQPRFAKADSFHEGLAAVAVPVTQAEKLKLLAAKLEFECGFIDSKGNQIIPPRFTGARHFSEGLAAVQENFKWGFMNEKGDVVISPQFDDVRSFSQGFAAVKKDEKWGFIDKSGKFSIEPRFSSRDTRRGNPIPAPTDFSEGLTLACEQDLNWHYCDITGKESFAMPVRMPHCGEPLAKPFKEGLAPITTKYFSSNYGFINQSGRFQIKNEKFGNVGSFSEGLAWIQIKTRDNTWKKGFIDKKGEIAINPTFDQVSDFTEGFAPVSFGSGKPQSLPAKPALYISKDFPRRGNEKLWGYINREGKVVVEPRFNTATPFSEGLAAVKLGEKWGFIDGTGKLVIQAIFDDAKPFASGIAVVKQNGLFGYINRDGNFSLKPQYWVCGSFSNGRALIVRPTRKNITASTEGIYRSMPIQSNSDVLQFLFQHGSAPDDTSWAGWRN